MHVQLSSQLVVMKNSRKVSYNSKTPTIQDYAISVSLDCKLNPKEHASDFLHAPFEPLEDDNMSFQGQIWLCSMKPPKYLKNPGNELTQ